MTRADLDKQPHEVAEMFDGVAERYDLTNTVLSAGQDRGWRRATRVALGLRPGERVLDVGAGTGVSTAKLSRSGAFAVGADLSVGMLRAGRKTRRTVPLVAGDALRLPFPDAAFDAVTISFALRNVVDTDAALRELGRVTRTGGRLVICEFSHPINPAVRSVYLNHVMRTLPAVARTVASNPEAYVYLAESIRAWPDQAALAARIAAAGPWTRVGWRNLTGGIVALHRATRT
ncbi:MAG TPA: demethylmenaquinone methyltransferase [Actinoplanes sp.]|nr:demethylmenaquinone methyltransferase [Actinoplanes sp.]